MTDLRFYPLEADGAEYPRSAVPLLAQPSWAVWLGRRDAGEASAFFKGGESFMYGRYALAEAMRRAGAASGNAVLLPAFHCRAIVEPAMYLGAEPRFYPVTSDLRPNFNALSELMAAGTPIVAMVVTHYFGFPNALDEAKGFCLEHGIALIEDCAHALYGRAAGQLLGSVGDFAAASLWKFLPVRDGAVLLDNTGKKARNRFKSPSLSSEIKGLGGLVEAWIMRAWHSKPLPRLDESIITAEAEKIRTQHVARLPELGLKEFVPSMAERKALCSSRWLAAAGSHGYVASRRRDNYLKWLDGIRDVHGVAALYPNLPEGVVPYAFPLLLRSPRTDFHRLKTAGVPFWRWEDMAVTDCGTSGDYRLRLLQLPCHQDLMKAELEWMIRAVQTLTVK